MTEQDLTLLIASLLFAAFTLGWAAHWLWSVITRKRSPEALRVEAMAAEGIPVVGHMGATVSKTQSHHFDHRMVCFGSSNCSAVEIDLSGGGKWVAYRVLQH